MIYILYRVYSAIKKNEIIYSIGKGMELNWRNHHVKWNKLVAERQVWNLLFVKT
jgi:hypothetical protein